MIRHEKNPEYIPVGVKDLVRTDVEINIGRLVGISQHTAGRLRFHQIQIMMKQRVIRLENLYKKRTVQSTQTIRMLLSSLGYMD